MLEAIHSFSPDAETQVVVGNVASIDEQRRQRVPRQRISDFTGDVVVTATLQYENDDKQKFLNILSNENIEVEPNILLDKFTYGRIQRYKNGDF